MKRKAILAVMTLVLLVACSPSLSSPASSRSATPTYAWDSQGWNLVWGDEFNGTTIDPANWNFDKGGGGWGNVEMEYYTDRPENARVENGMLVIEARREEYKRLQYTSARLNTRDLQEFTYGRIEARMKLPSGQGIWPAFWMLGSNASWPLGGEMDIMEYVGKTPNTIYQTVHGPGYSGPSGIGSQYVVSEESLKNDFHVYAIDWEPEDIRWYFDGQQVFQVTPDILPSGKQWVFDHPFFILLNLAVGGGWPGSPDNATVFPQQLLVDYVRVYQKQ
jgi:beta-glucanase (GH16 family)